MISSAAGTAVVVAGAAVTVLVNRAGVELDSKPFPVVSAGEDCFTGACSLCGSSVFSAPRFVVVGTSVWGAGAGFWGTSTGCATPGCSLGGTGVMGGAEETRAEPVGVAEARTTEE